MKKCSKCQVTKPYSEFRTVKPGKGCKMNLHSWCYACKRQARRQDYQNKKQQYAQQNKNFWNANPEARRAHDLNRRALEKSAEGMVTKSIVRQVFETYGTSCLACGSSDRVEIDHIIPLTKGGTNLFENLQPLCKICNVRKGNRTSADYRVEGEGRTTA